MFKKITQTIILVGCLGFGTSANATPILGDLTDGSLQVSDVTGAWDLNANAGDIITVTLRRLSVFDPWAYVSFGSRTFCEPGTQFSSCNYGVDWGDDQLGNNGYGGGWGDPQFTFTADIAGLYTIIGTQCCGSSPANDGLAYRHNIQATGSTYTAAVPEPATLALFGIGLAGLGFARRKKKSA